MKKKYAITLSALVLLSAGITLFGLKSKNKKETGKIEKDLKEVLIPNAERKLDSLQKEYESTIASYEEQVKQMGGLEKTLDSLEQAVVLEEQMKHVDSLFEKLSNQWYSKYNHIIEELGLTAYGEDGCFIGYEEVGASGVLYNPRTNKEERLYQEFYYLTGNQDRYVRVPIEEGKTLLVDSLYIPGRTARTFHIAINGDTWWGEEKNVKGFYTRDIDEFLWAMSGFAIPIVSDTVHAYYYLHEGAQMFPMDASLEYAISVLNALQRFVDGIDNSGNVFDSKTLSDLKKTVKVLRAGIEKQISVTRKLNETQKKVSGYRDASSRIQRRIQKQNDELRKYKSPDIVNQMRVAKKRGSK